VYPRDRYESEGGPRAVDVVATLRRAGRPATREEDASRFVDGLLFNYLIGAPDAHAKNYSVPLLADDVRLAPLSDVASGLAHERRTLPGLGSAAMAIGGVRALGDVSRRHLERFASEARPGPAHRSSSSACGTWRRSSPMQRPMRSRTRRSGTTPVISRVGCWTRSPRCARAPSGSWMPADGVNNGSRRPHQTATTATASVR
jgi:hypothetical protein